MVWIFHAAEAQGGRERATRRRRGEASTAQTSGAPVQPASPRLSTSTSHDEHDAWWHSRRARHPTSFLSSLETESERERETERPRTKGAGERG